MKVYVDEMPKNCNNCPCKGNKYCNLSFTECKAKRPEDCWLELIADHDKQVRADERKKVCEQIRRFAYDTFQEWGVFDETDLEHILDQIEKGENNGSVDN